MQDHKTRNFLINAKHWFVLLLLIALTALAYSNTLHSPFVLDDYHTFVGNPDINVEKFSFSALKKLSSTVFGFARLIPIITFAVDYSIGGGDVVQYHLTNIAVHLLCVIALFFFLKGILATNVGKESLRSMSPVWFSLATVALWALNPVQTNAVTYIVQRMTSIAALFYVSSLTFYIYGRISSSPKQKVSFFVFSLLSASLAFMSKENSFILPLTVLTIESYFLSPGLLGRMRKALGWKQWLVVFLVLLLFMPIIVIFMQDILAGYNSRAFTLEQRILTQFRVVVFYISLLFLPLPGRLNLDHDFSLSLSLITPLSTLFSLILLLALFAFGIKVRKSSPLVSFGIIWFFLHLLIESTVIPLEIIFEHRLYLPSIGFFITVTALFDIFAKVISKRFAFSQVKIILTSMVVIIVISSSILTYARNEDWRDQITIFSDIVQKSPNKARPRSDLAIAYAEAGKIQEAIKENLTAIKLNPDYAYAYNNLGHLYRRMGLLDRAIKYYQQALQLQPKQWQAYNNLGLAYSMKGLTGKAVEMFEGALAKNPSDPGIHINLGDVYLKMRSPEQAIREYRQALSLDSEYETAYNKLGIVYGKMGKMDEAIKYFLEALRVNPRSPITHHNIANAYMMKGNVGKAREHKEEAEKLQRISR